MAAASNKLFSPRDIGSSINNAILAASQPEDFAILESRLRKLSEYTSALVAPCNDHVDKGLLDYRELVVVLLSAALLVNATHTISGDKLPMYSLAKQIQKKG